MASEDKIIKARNTDLKSKEYKSLKFLLVTVFYLLFLLMPLPQGLSESARRSLVVFAYAASLWMLGALPPTLTALLSMISLPMLGVLSIEDTLAGFGNQTVWLLFGILLISVAIQESRLDKRIALSLLRLAHGNSRLIVIMIGMVALVLTFIMPTSVGRAALMTPICMGLVNALGLKPGSNLGKSIFLVFSFTSLLASAGVITGAIVTIYAANIFQDSLGITWTYLRWLVFMLPGALIAAFVSWVTLLLVFPPEYKTVPGGVQYIDEQLKDLGKIQAIEFRMAIIMIVLIILWITGSSLGISIGYACLIMAIVTVLPGIGIIGWSKANKLISWNSILLLGAVLGIAKGLSNTGVFKWVSGALFFNLSYTSSIVVVLLIVLLVVVMRLGFPNSFTVIAILLPIVFTIASEAQINPVWIGLLTINTSSLGVFLPSQAITHMTTFSSGYYQIKDMQRSGSIIAVVSIVFYLAIAYLYWPLLGISVTP